MIAQDRIKKAVDRIPCLINWMWKKNPLKKILRIPFNFLIILFV